ncbi:Integrase zinc binding domain [Popillia japonica]|uniref:Integrase zinc binding domain n=1 Tax=Popillia japonica TaxID=7064 RepID=A0AAW1MDT2_POPJA
MTNFSSYSRLRRVTAYCFRFAKNSALAIPGCDELPLIAFDLPKIPRYPVMIVLQAPLPQITKSKPLKPSSKLSSLNLFLDSSGIIRVGGRLSNSQFAYDKKHPIILSGKHHLSKLIVTHEHLRLLHAGPQLLLSSLRDKFWIIAGRNIVKKVVHDCIRCLRFSPQSEKGCT